MSQVYDEPIVVRLRFPLKGYPAGAEFGFKRFYDAILVFGNRYYLDVVQTQAGIPVPPTPALYGLAEYGLADYDVVIPDWHRTEES